MDEVTVFGPQEGQDPARVAARAREAATREILEVISQSRNDDRPVFEVVLRKAADLCHAPSASLLIISEDRSHAVLVADWGHGQVSGLIQVGTTVWPMESGYAPSACMREGRIVHIHDMADTDLYRSGDPLRVAAVEEDGIRTFLAVPLFSGGQTVGCILVYRREVRPFSADEIALVETFAAQSVIAIENVRQFRELQTRLEREAATRDILSAISQSRDDDAPVFDVIARHSAKLCNAQMAWLLVAADQKCTFKLVGYHGLSRRQIELGDVFELDTDPGKITGVGRAIFEAQTIQDEDLAQSQHYLNDIGDMRTLVDVEGIRTRLCVPLISGGVGIGAILLTRREVARFTADEIALVETFAAQAVIAIENVRQFRELQTRLAREAATREILEVISQSRDDDGPVFDAVLRNANRLCGTSMAYLVLGRPDDTVMTLAAYVNPHLPSQDAVDQIITFSNQTGMRMDAAEHFSAKAILSGEVVQIADIATTPGYLSGEPTTRILVEDVGVRTILSVPMFDAQSAIGAISLQRREERPFSDDEVALIQSFAAQAVIAIENVRQFRELQTRLAREAATREILEVISQSRDDDQPVFDVVLRKAAELCHAPMASLLTISEDRSHAVLAADWGHEDVADALRVGETVWPMDSPHSFIAVCLHERRIVHVHNLIDTDRYRSGDRNAVTAVEVEGIRTLLAVPLFSGGQTVACILVYRREVRPFTPDEIALVETFAAQAAIAIENVRQFKALEALNTELGDRVQVQVGEIERMGRLKRFLPAAVADTVISSGSEKLLSSHRALLGVLFADIRGFTSFCETAEPEETIEVLQTYHEEMGKLIAAHGAGVDHRMGDGIMVLFNDPLPCDDPAGDALRLAMAMRGRMAELCRGWKKMGHKLGFGLGVSLGYATVGMVGSGGRFDYTASGTAINLASRLCDEAQDGEILISPRARTAVEDHFTVESRGEISFKGIREPVEVFCVTGVVG